MNEAWMDEFDETFKIVKQITSRGYLTRMGKIFQLIDIPELKQFIAQKLEAQASRLLIEITANCKATTEALMEEARKEYEECIYDLVFAYVNKDEDMPHKFESQALKDAIKLSVKAKEFLDNDYLVQKYAIGEK